MMYGHGWGMWLIPVLFILAAYLVIKNISQGRNFQNGETPLEILKKRYARGEITREQFEEMKKDL